MILQRPHMTHPTFSSRQKGQIMVMMMIAILPLAGLISLVLNGGELVTTKTRLQNAADTASLSEAAWVARSLNVMSMNNTAMTQSMAIGTAGYALEGPIIKAGFNAGEVHGFYMGTAAYSFKRMAENTGGFPFNPLFYYYAIKGAVYTGMAVAFYFDVVKPLAALASELPRAMHDDEEKGGFSRAAELFGRMNELIVNDSPAKIVAHVDSVTALNSVATAPARYYAFGDSTSQLALPVIKQDILEGLKNMFDSSGGFADVWKSADGVKNVLNVCSTGTKGTYSTPANVEMDFFANFTKHGYEKGNGPKMDLYATSAAEFTAVHSSLNSWAKGNFGFSPGGSVDGEVQNQLGGMTSECEAGRPEPDEADFENDPAGFQRATDEFDQFNSSCEAVADFDINSPPGGESSPENWLFTSKIPVWANDIEERQKNIWRWACTYRRAPYSKQKDPAGEFFDFVGVEMESFLPPGYAMGLPFGGKTGWGEYPRLALKKGPRRGFEYGLWGIGANFLAQPGTYEAHYKSMISYMIPTIPMGSTTAVNVEGGENETDGKAFNIVAPRFEARLYAVTNARFVPDQLGSFVSGISPTRNDWSLLSVAYEAREGAPFMGPLFNDPTGEISAVAQSELYNAQWYDLYTQNWRAKLVPARLVNDDKHRSAIGAAVNDAKAFANLVNAKGAQIVPVR